MPAAALLQPDTAFIKDLLASGGGDLKKCFQCATCSAICALSPDESPFPRKQMIEAQWGLKDRLLGDPAIWLCHDCGDCTTYCPRAARPGDVFGALRQQAIQHFAFPSFLGRMAASPIALTLLLLFPILIFAAIALWAPKGPATEHLEFSNLFPIPIIEALFFAVAGLVVLAFGVGLARFLKALRTSGAGGKILAGLIPALVVILAHQRFAECSSRKIRRLGHLLALGGFTGLALMGTAVGIGTMAGLMRTPLPLTNPWKIFANLGAAVILIGLGILFVDRISRAASTYFDWFFLLNLVGVVVTGVASELLRLAQAMIMYGVYFAHLVLVFALFLYAPYSKFAHFLYRTVAMAAVRRQS